MQDNRENTFELRCLTYSRLPVTCKRVSRKPSKNPRKTVKKAMSPADATLE